MMTKKSTDGSNRRRGLRVDIAVDLQLLAPEFQVSVPSRTMNLSTQGALIRASRRLPVGTPVRVAFGRGPSRNPLTLDGVVVRADQGNAGTEGMAARFTSITALDESLISDLIAKAQA